MITAQKIVDLLNEMAKLDPVATVKLVDSRVKCNDDLANHPTIQVTHTYEVGLLGVLSGIAALENPREVIVAQFDDETKKLLGFVAGRIDADGQVQLEEEDDNEKAPG